MIKRFEELLAQLGLKREAGTRSFALDASLHTVLVALAEREQRPAEDVYADLLATALAQRQTN
ncbi:MAG: hypothetical protein WC832_06605 [Anaerolineales bacterium]